MHRGRYVSWIGGPSQPSCTQGVSGVCAIALRFHSFGCGHRNAGLLIDLVQHAVMGDREGLLATCREEDQRRHLCSFKGIQGELLVAGEVRCDVRR